MENSERIAEEQTSPGELLRAARQALDISQREMADRLNWMPSYVVAVEENRFDVLRGAAFVRGYLRAYAKMVEVPEDQLMAAYAAHQGEEQKREENGRRVESRVPQVSKRGVALPAGAIIVLALVFMLWYLQGDEERAGTVPVSGTPDYDEVDEPQRAEALVQEQAVPMPMVAESPTQVDVPRERDADEGESAAIAEIAEDSSVARVADASVGLVADETAANVASATPAESGPAIFEPEAQQAATGARSSEPASITVESPIASDAGVASELHFRFSGDCWVEVRNAAEELIYADLRRNGDTLKLSGEAPFEILLGDARVVELDYQGEAFEIERRPGRAIARFRVGEE